MNIAEDFDSPRRMWTPRFAFSLAVGLALAACGGSAPSEEGHDEEAAGEAAFVEMDTTAATTVGLEIVPVTEIREETLRATGVLGFDLNRVARVAPRAEGRVVSIEKDLGDRVRRGEALAVLESPELAEAEAAHAQAKVEMELARENYEREAALYEKGISSRKEMLEARTEYETKTAEYESALARHRTLGATEHSDDPGSLRGLYTVSSPLDGVVVARDLVQGQIVGPEDDIFTVADISHLWLTLDIYDRDLARLREGLEVEVRTSAFPDETFRGTLTYVGQVMDSVTRTVKARVEVDNPDQKLRPGMFATATIRGVVPRGTAAVPEEAVQQMEGRTVVFVPDPADPNRFLIRDVEVGPRLSDGLITVLGGISVGEKVVGRGSFYLKSELLKESFGGDEH
ncbi:MAG: efflux RND transporter periplasmic adaptor subunit [Gemmatimonadota bacterium]